MSKNKRQPEYVKWIDSHTSVRGTSQWIFPDDIQHKIDPIDTVGYPIYEDKKVITYAAQLSQDCVGGVITIPKCAIVKRRKLK